MRICYDDLMYWDMRLPLISDYMGLITVQYTDTNYWAIEPLDPNVRVVASLDKTGVPLQNTLLCMDNKWLNTQLTSFPGTPLRDFNYVLLYNCYHTDAAKTCDIETVTLEGSGSTCTITNLGSGYYRINYPSTHGASVGDLCHIVPNATEGQLPWNSNYYMVDTIDTTTAFSIRESPATLTLATSYKVWVSSDNMNLSTVKSGVVVPAQDFTSSRVPFSISYFTKQTSKHGIVVRFQATTTNGGRYVIGRMKAGEYFEPRLMPEPPLSAPYETNAQFTESHDGAKLSTPRNLPRNMRVNLVLDDVEASGISEVSRINDMLYRYGSDNDIFVDIEPEATTTRARDLRVLGRITQHTGPVATGETLNGGNKYRFSMNLRESL